MNIRLTTDQEAFVRDAVAAGRLKNADDAVREALELWEQRERLRAELLAAIDEAEASVASGFGIEFTPQSVTELAEDVKRNGREYLAKAPEPAGR